MGDTNLDGYIDRICNHSARLRITKTKLEVILEMKEKGQVCDEVLWESLQDVYTEIKEDLGD